MLDISKGVEIVLVAHCQIKKFIFCSVQPKGPLVDRPACLSAKTRAAQAFWYLFRSNTIFLLGSSVKPIATPTVKI